MIDVTYIIMHHEFDGVNYYFEVKGNYQNQDNCAIINSPLLQYALFVDYLNSGNFKVKPLTLTEWVNRLTLGMFSQPDKCYVIETYLHA